MKPPAVFPGGIATDADLLFGDNRVITMLANGVSSTDIAITVADATYIAVNMVLSLDRDGEIVKVTGPPIGRTIPVQRGFDSTIPTAHAAGAVVLGNIVAWHHNALASEIEAIERALGPNLTNIQVIGVITTAFEFPPQAPGGALAAGQPNVVTLSPVPLGVNGSDRCHYLYISGGTGTPEAVLITGGTAVGGAPSGTVTFVPVNAHTGAWTIQSATAGTQEAVNASPIGSLISIPAGSYTWHAGVLLPTDQANYLATHLKGGGRATTVILISTDASPSVPTFQSSGQCAGAFVEPGPTVEDLAVVYPQPDSTDLSLYNHWVGCGFDNTARFEVRNISLFKPWIGIRSLGNSGGAVINGLWDSAFHAGIYLDGAEDTVRVSQWHHFPFLAGRSGVTNNQLLAFTNLAVFGGMFGRVDSLLMSDTFSFSGRAYRFFAGADGNASSAYLTNALMDSYGGLVVEAGYVLICGGAITMAPEGGNVGIPGAHADGIVQSGGALYIVNMIFINETVGYHTISVTGGRFSLTNSPGLGSDSGVPSRASMISVQPSTGQSAIVTLMGNLLDSYPPQVAFANALVEIGAGTRLIAIGNHIAERVAPQVPWLHIAQDNYHNISDNVFPAWTVSLPVPSDNTGLLGIYQDQNFEYPQPYTAMTLTGPISYRPFGRLETFFCDATAGTVNVDLMPASLTKGSVFTIKKIDASANPAGIVTYHGVEMIDGVVGYRYIYTQWETLSVQSDGTQWFIV